MKKKGKKPLGAEEVEEKKAPSGLLKNVQMTAGRRPAAALGTPIP
jgi:hypothetical protein